MTSDILSELRRNITKLSALEDSIIYGEKMGTNELRSKQALLISEIIQSLQDLEMTIKKESHFTVTRQQESLIRI